MIQGRDPALSLGRPFPGLRPFGYGDSDYFFGRSAQYYALYRLLGISRFVAVVGSSGSGKSSLVRAGLLPLLAEENRENEGRWAWLEMRPGQAPRSALADALVDFAAGQGEEDDDFVAVRAQRIAYHLKGSSHGIARALKEIGPTTRSIVLVVDQFEELFRFAADPAGSRSASDDARQREEAAQFVQLLLEGSRDPDVDLHILITMRSDFIGDCARFQGLPEAVSATQFLVPSLTRDQREEVIRKPVEKAGAAIEPTLVERLLNDSSDEMDQLPVLQHCLLRLWDAATPAAATDAADLPRRRIGMAEYDRIGRMAQALSVHADEIIRDELAGLESVVARVFRSLSEVDRHGRATRRAIAFGRLLAETGAPEHEVRSIVDRFRAADCSFLVTSPPAIATLDRDTRVDIGHEALLRHWRRISGEPGATGERDDPRPVGWMRQERMDGQRYQALLAMVGDESGEQALLSPDQLERYWRWWKEEPRTIAWTERYGGRRGQVRRLLAASRAAERAETRARLAWEAQMAAKERGVALQRRIALGALIVLLILSVATGAVIYDQYRKVSEQQALATQMTEQSVASFNAFTERLSESVRGGMTPETAVRLLKALDDTAAGVPADFAQGKAAKARMLMTVADAWSNYGDDAEALKRAKEASQLSDELLLLEPDSRRWQRLAYSSAFRVADRARALDKSEDVRRFAEERYRFAETLATRLSEAEPERGDRLFDLAFIRNKVAEVLGEQLQSEQALAQYAMALDAIGAAVKAEPSNVRFQAFELTLHSKMGRILSEFRPPRYDEALAAYAKAIERQEALRQQTPSNETLLSNLATSYRDRAQVYAARNQNDDFDRALEGYRTALEIGGSLHARDPVNARWISNILAPTFSATGDLYLTRQLYDDARTAWQEELKLRQLIVSQSPGNKRVVLNLEAVKRRLAQLDQAQAARQSSSTTPAAEADEASEAVDP